jgi:N-acetylneuraminic acid mutarotase
VKVHQHELIEVKEKQIMFYQPFKGTRRRVNIEDEKLTEMPTLVNTKETGRLLIIGGNKGYRSSNKVYQVDECMNTLKLHSKLTVGRVGHAAVYINNKDIYVIGGYNSDSNQWLASVETCVDAFSASPEEPPRWEKTSEMNNPRYYFGCCTWNNTHIFVFGGMNEGFMQQ